MSLPTIGILGGTGKEGRGLATRLAAAGYAVVIGSRDADRAATAAEAVAATVAEVPGSIAPSAGVNEVAAAAGEVVIVAVPWSAHDATLRSVRDRLAGKILVDVVVPLGSPPTEPAPPQEGSAAARARALLSDDVRVVAAFHSVAAGRLMKLGAEVGCDVLVVGDDPGAKRQVVALAEALGLAAYDAGTLANASVVEGLTAVLIAINKAYGARDAGLRITGIDAARLRGADEVGDGSQASAVPGSRQSDGGQSRGAPPDSRQSRGAPPGGGPPDGRPPDGGE